MYKLKTKYSLPYRIFFAIIFALVFVKSGFTQSYPENQNFKISIKMGANMSTLVGTELQNPRPKISYHAGVYYLQKLSNSLALYTEFGGAIKGSKFKNGLDEYNRVNLFELSLPVMLNFEIKENQVFGLGVAPTTYPISSVYLQGKSQTHQNKLGLKPIGLDIVTGYTKYYDVIALQILASYGVININDNLYFDKAKPLTGKGGTIYPVSLSINILF